ncbi:MAG: hypothetical protein WC447_01355 [Candidatus Paceibacterota bacterium]|jgi:SMC interacting uncharacterized protein involved in chromosome segregation
MSEGLVLGIEDRNIDEFEELSKKKDKLSEELNALQMQLESLMSKQSDTVIRGQQMNYQETKKEIENKILVLKKQINGIDNELATRIKLES